MAATMLRSRSTRKSRPTSSANRLPVCLLGGDDLLDNPKALQRQRLQQRFSMSAALTDALAAIIWGERHD